MSFTIQTNVNAMVAQENLRVNGEFQSRTIQHLTSGYRINQSGDDAAGLSVANKYRSDIAELDQGVRNANDGISALQIVDGGLNNISKMLDRMKTLATQSASMTFTGNRSQLNREFQTLTAEITRQATNIGLAAGGSYLKNTSVYIGGATTQTNASISIDLTSNQVDATGLGLNSTSIDASPKGTLLTGNAVDLTSTSSKFLVGGTQTFKVTSAGKTQTDVVIDGGTTGLTGQEALDQLNIKLSQFGITASLSTAQATLGRLQFNSGGAFAIDASTAVTGGNAIATVNAATVAVNTGIYNVSKAYSQVAADAQTLSFTVGGATTDVTLAVGTTIDDAITAVNAQMNSSGIYAMKVNGKLSIQSANAFSLSTAKTTATSGFDNGTVGSVTLDARDTTLSSDPTSQAKAALILVNEAVSKLGLAQGKVGAGQNQLAYAITLAQSQITNFSAAESRIRDADVAQEAANLTKAQVLQQASLAAMAQANSAPQAVMALLRG